MFSQNHFEKWCRYLVDKISLYSYFYATASCLLSRMLIWMLNSCRCFNICAAFIICTAFIIFICAATRCWLHILLGDSLIYELIHLLELSSGLQSRQPSIQARKTLLKVTFGDRAQIPHFSISNVPQMSNAFFLRRIPVFGIWFLHRVK